MKRVTRDIDPGSARDLLQRIPRACLAFADHQGPLAQPVVVVWEDEHYLVGMPQEVDPRLRAGQEVVLLIDEGVHFFDLRALYIRGQVQPAEPPRRAPADRRWMEVVPLKTVAWDYGRLREVQDDH